MRAYVYKSGERYCLAKEPMSPNARVVDLASGEYVRIAGHWDDDWKQRRLQKLYEKE